MSLMGLDVGTTGVKAVVFDLSGKMISQAYREYHLISPKPGFRELDAHVVWACVRFVIQKANQGSRKDPVEALAVSSMAESFVPVDKEGRFLCNAIANVDTRNDLRSYFDRKIGLYELFKMTGQPYHAIFSLNKYLWLKKTAPSIYERTAKFLCFEDLVCFKLCGEPVTDPSIASRVFAYDLGRQTWSNRILTAVDIDPDKLPKILPSGTIAGSMSKKTAKEYGFREGVRVVTGSIDQAAAAVGVGAVEEGVAVDSIGTAECITPAFRRAQLTKEMFRNNYCCTPHAEKGMYVTFAYNFTGGSLLKWYRDHMSGTEIAEANKRKKDVYEEITSGLPKAPTGLLLLPHFTVTGSPYFDTSSKGALLGMTLSTTRKEIVKALLEGVSYEMVLNIKLLEKSGIKVKEIRAMGGGSRSDVWLQLKADMYGVNISAPDVAEAGCQGAAIMAGVAVGRYKSTADALKRTLRIKRVFSPDKEKHRIYLEKFNLYKEVYPRLRPLFGRM